MDERMEVLERALCIMAAALAFDPWISPEMLAGNQEQLIHTAKMQALSDMQMAREKYGKR